MSEREMAVLGIPEANTEISVCVELEEAPIAPTVAYVRAELREREIEDEKIDVKLIFEPEMDGAKIMIEVPNGEPVYYGSEDSSVEITTLSVYMRVVGYSSVTVPIRNLFSIEDSTITFTVVIVGFDKTADWEVVLKPTISYTDGSYTADPVNVRINYNEFINSD